MDRYKNFVKSSVDYTENSASCSEVPARYFLSGEEAKQIYLQEISKGKQRLEALTTSSKHNYITKVHNNPFNDKELRLAVESNQADIVRKMLQIKPEKVDLLDNFGWSLLMIACQANAEDSVKVLLDYKADTYIQDKAGNSARSLVIQNKNFNLAQLFLKQKSNKDTLQKYISLKKRKLKNEFACVICDNKVFNDKTEHLSSIIHNINASKGAKPKTCYKIPKSNRGYQIMLKNGWDRDNGLGRDGSGQKYPIRTIQKLDKKGLGLEKLKPKKTEDLTKLNPTPKPLKSGYYKTRRMEINFRREFY